MATNLVSSVMQFLTRDLIAKIARTLDLNSEVAQKVVGAAVPAILASFAGLAAKPAGAQQLFDTLEQQGPDIPSQIAGAIGGPDQKAIADTGSGLLSALLGGSELNTLVSAVSTFSGISQNACKSVLGLLAPMVVGALGQQQRSGGLDASGLANLLSSQKDQIVAVMPFGLANTLGARGMLDALDGSLRRGADTATAAAGRMADATGWFADWIYAQVAQAVPAQGGTVRVRTTLDVRLQELAQNVVQSTLATYGAEKNASQAALVAMRPDGAIVAMVGGGSYAGSQFNRAVQAKRQPGSAFKLFDYYAALRQGFSPNSEIFDAPIQVGHWQPVNYSRHYHQEVTLANAFANSLNAATVRLAQQVGIDQVIAAARDLGLRGSLRNTPSVALGTSEVSLLDLTAAYAAVRAGMAPVQPWGIASIRTDKGDKDLLIGGPDVVQHSLAPYQDQLISLLQGVVQHGTGRAAALQGFAAGKTGTTQDYRDAWFIGFNNSLVVGVWVGNDDHSPMNGVVGGTIPAMIWKRFVEQASPPTKTIKAKSGDTETALRSSRGAGSRRGPPAASKSWIRVMPRLASTARPTNLARGRLPRPQAAQ